MKEEIKTYIKENLRIDVDTDYGNDGCCNWLKIKLILEDEEISQVSFSLD
jgi:hypothetical protein